MATFFLLTSLINLIIHEHFYKTILISLPDITSYDVRLPMCLGFALLYLCSLCEISPTNNKTDVYFL